MIFFGYKRGHCLSKKEERGTLGVKVYSGLKKEQSRKRQGWLPGFLEEKETIFLFLLVFRIWQERLAFVFFFEERKVGT